MKVEQEYCISFDCPHIAFHTEVLFSALERQFVDDWLFVPADSHRALLKFLIFNLTESGIWQIGVHWNVFLGQNFTRNPNPSSLGRSITKIDRFWPIHFWNSHICTENVHWKHVFRILRHILLRENNFHADKCVLNNFIAQKLCEKVKLRIAEKSIFQRFMIYYRGILLISPQARFTPNFIQIGKPRGHETPYLAQTVRGRALIHIHQVSH